MKNVVAGIIPVFNDLMPAPRAAFDPPLNTGGPFGPGKECIQGELDGDGLGLRRSACRRGGG
ncbi:MAG: hypothetical protein ACKOFP_09785 [Actinomycetota bacterium]